MEERNPKQEEAQTTAQRQESELCGAPWVIWQSQSPWWFRMQAAVSGSLQQAAVSSSRKQDLSSQTRSLTTGPQGPAARAWGPSPYVRWQERIQARRQKVKKSRNFIGKVKYMQKDARANSESRAFGKFKSFIRCQSSGSLSSFWPVVLFWTQG